MSERTSTTDLTKKFARLIEQRKDGLVEFEFAIGDPELFVEMLLPRRAYEAFCSDNEVVHLPARGQEVNSDWGWRLHEASHQRFR